MSDSAKAMMLRLPPAWRQERYQAGPRLLGHQKMPTMAPIHGIQNGPFHMDLRADSQPSASKTRVGMTTTRATPMHSRMKGHVLVSAACQGR